ncbi:MAG TPA: J domain-containing protein [Acidobacteriota bacterium]|nr:J domain-containing protein [Acidobacteriota bacterium]
MARKDYYAVLGVAKTAAAEDIKRAYRKLARKWHPDVNPGDEKAEERFKEISEAYHVLGEPERRKKYDQVGPEAFARDFDGSGFAEQFGDLFRGGGYSVGGFNIEDLLGGFGGRGSPGGHPHARRPPPARGRDVRVRVELGLEDALNGAERLISYQGEHGPMQRTRVGIPAGVRQGSKVRVRGKGAAGFNGGGRGDLYVEVGIAAHPRFRLVGDDLHTRVPITIYEAALGGRVEVPTLSGTATISLPAGTANGQVFRLRGKGATRRAGGSGDLMAKVAIELPAQLDDEMLEIMQQLRDQHPYDPRADSE